MADPIAYLDHVAAASEGRDYKRRVLAALDLRPGQTVLDIGCGPGTDLSDMAALVGSVIGVDHNRDMVAEARRRTSAEIRLGDAHALPVEDHGVDRVRVDRVLHQVANPAAVLAEIRRVLKPGGVAVVAQPDWETLAVDPGDVATNRLLNRFVRTDILRHATIGRQVPRLAQQVGFDVRSVATTAPVFREFGEADRILGFSRNSERAVKAGRLDRTAADQWLAALRGGPFLATFILFTVVLVA